MALKLALLRLQKSQATSSDNPRPKPVPSPDAATIKTEYALKQKEWKARQSEMSLEKQRIDYEIANSNGPERQEWQHKLALLRLQKKSLEQEQELKKAELDDEQSVEKKHKLESQ